jgi:hypothetical protein
MKSNKLVTVLCILLLLTTLALLYHDIPDHRQGKGSNIETSEALVYVWKVKRVVNDHELVVVDQFNSTFRLTVRDTKCFKKGDILSGNK